MKRSLTRLGLAVVATLLAACGCTQMPTTRVASSAAAVRSAHEVGADSVPEAALQVRMAQDQLRTVQRMIQDGETEKADMLLAQSQSDAELAIGLTRASKAKADSDVALSKLRVRGRMAGVRAGAVSAVRGNFWTTPMRRWPKAGLDRLGGASPYALLGTEPSAPVEELF